MFVSHVQGHSGLSPGLHLLRVHILHCSPRKKFVQRIPRGLARGLGDHVSRYCHDTCSHPHLIFLNHSRRDQWLRMSPVGSTIPLSHALSSTSSEKRLARPDPPGIVAATIMKFVPEKDCWRGSRLTDTLRLLRSNLGVASCTTTRGFSVARRKGKSCALCTTPSRGEPVVLGLISTLFLTTVFPFQNSHSIIATHLFETVLPSLSQTAQALRSAPDTSTPELFVLSHGMLFTNIQLDDFSATLVLLERLDIEGPVWREWTMMTVVNIGALSEYSRQQGVLRRTCALN